MCNGPLRPEISGLNKWVEETCRGILMAMIIIEMLLLLKGLNVAC